MRQAFFHLQAEHNHTGARRIELNREAMDFYRYIISQVNTHTADIKKLAAQLAADDPTVSESNHRLMLGFVARLAEQLPQLAPIAYEHGLISIPMACAMERAFQDLPTSPGYYLITSLEQALVRKLTPKIPDQHLPSARALVHLIRTCLQDALVVGTPKPTAPSYWVTPSPTKGMWLLTAEVDQVTAESIDRHLTAYANANHVSTVDALRELVCGNGKTITVTIFGLGAFQPNTPLVVNELERTGELGDQQALQQIPQRYRNILEIALLCRSIYAPTPEQKFTTRQRDGHCRYPGCTTPAAQCDIDHVIPFDAGGWTTLGNLQCLCRHHHNMKTDRKIRAEMTPDGAVTWHDTNPELGEQHKHLGTTLPEGPLAGLSGRQDSTTRHSGKTKQDENTDPPIRHGLGRFGSTLEQHNRAVHEHRNTRRHPPEPDIEPPF